MWEYYNEYVVSPGIDSKSHDRRMKELGDDGWELCAAVFWNEHAKYRMFFKRPKRIDNQGPYR